MRSLVADAALQHGLNPYANIIDELHAHRTADLYTALTTGTGAREQPFTLWISTAGVDAPGILVELHASCSTDPASSRTAARCSSTATAPTASSSGGTGHRGMPTSRTPRSGSPPTPRPGSGTARTSSQEYARLKARGALLEWRRYHLNQFVGTEEAWLPEGAWT